MNERMNELASGPVRAAGSGPDPVLDSPAVRGLVGRMNGFVWASSVFGVTYSVSVDGKHGLSLWQAGRVVDLTDPSFSSALPQV